MELTHFDEAGRARMVDVGGKVPTAREAVARGWVQMRPETLALIKAKGLAKGDVLGVAQVAGIMGAKWTPHLIPLCHPLPLTGVDLRLDLDEAKNRVLIEARVKTVAQTGVEMEALTAVAVAALAVYDMCKAVDKTMEIGGICLWEKTGGKSGPFRRETKE